MGEKKIILSPSLLSADFYVAGRQLEALENAGSYRLHLDVMDGIFVPNISFGQVVVRSLRKRCGMFFDTHLMITDPIRYIDDFAKAGSDSITVHLESCSDPAECLKRIAAHGIRAAIALKPASPAELAFPFLGLCGMVLVMTVEPGFGGQSFMHDMLPKISALKAEADRRGLNISIQVDGGIDRVTAPLAVEAGADDLVAGSSVFGADDPAAAAEAILAAAGAATGSRA